MDANSWKAALQDRLPADWAREIDDFELQIQLRKAGKIDEKLFAETRLRRGAYGQRYDNGQRHDGERTQTLHYPSGGLTKGPQTMWDAPGMQRIKIPYGRLDATQLEVLCDVAEEYSDEVLHITTRQDVQLHFVHIDDTPDLMRRLAAVGITTREACGNSVRNVTACAIAGVCRDEAFDVSAHAHATAFFLLGHPDTQDLGRKFKIAFSGCGDHACGITGIHDIGCIARTKTIGGQVERGFEVYVGGGLGPVPQQAQLYDPFVPEAELLPLCQAICRVFAKRGERANRARARMKFLLKKAGMVRFRAWVHEERARLEPDPRWTAYLDGVDRERPLPPRPVTPADSLPEPRDSHMALFLRHNIYLQRQRGLAAVTVMLPLGDLTAAQGRVLADLARIHAGGRLVTTVDQNLMLHAVALPEVETVYERLRDAGLATAGAGAIADVTSCPGTDTCKLGISSSRGLAARLGQQLEREAAAGDSVGDLHIKCSGCFNSCGQHHIADIGFLGVSRSVRGRRMPHFQLVVGGQWERNGGAFGLAVGAIPSKLVPDAVARLTDDYRRGRHQGESFQDYCRRIGKRVLRERLEDLINAGTTSSDPSLFRDWGDPRAYSIEDMGVGECAGEVISPLEFALAAGEQKVFEAQLSLEAGECAGAVANAHAAMLETARAIVRQALPLLPVPDDRAVIDAFRSHLVDTGRFESGGGRFGLHLLRSSATDDEATLASAQQRIEEAQMFLESAHEYRARETEA